MTVTTVAKPNIVDRLLDGRSTDPSRKRPSWAKPKLVVLHIQQGLNDLHDYWNGSNIDADCTIWNQQSGVLNRLLPDDTTPWTNGDTDNPTLSNPVIADIYNNKIPQYGAFPNGTGIFNHFSLTVEHQGFDYTGITATQAESTAQLAAYWCSLYNLDPLASIVGHRDIGKKTCPGAKFPLDQIRARAKDIIAAASQPDVTNPNSGATSWHCLPTDKWVTDEQGFLTYWRTNGGMNDFGYPISGAAYDNRYKDAKGNALIVQWFERARFEYHPENDNPYKVLLGLVGKELLAKL